MKTVVRTLLLIIAVVVLVSAVFLVINYTAAPGDRFPSGYGDIFFRSEVFAYEDTITVYLYPVGEGVETCSADWSVSSDTNTIIDEEDVPLAGYNDDEPVVLEIQREPGSSYTVTMTIRSPDGKEQYNGSLRIGQASNTVRDDNQTGI
jgi:hypothetical protein